MRTPPLSSNVTIPLLLVLTASMACWAGLAALMTGLMETWSAASGF